MNRERLGILLGVVVLLALTPIFLAQFSNSSDQERFADWKARFLQQHDSFEIVGEEFSHDWFMVVGKNKEEHKIAIGGWFRGDCPAALLNGEYHYHFKIQNPSSGESLIDASNLGQPFCTALKSHWLSGASLMGDVLEVGVQPQYQGEIAATVDVVVDARVQPQPSDLPKRAMTIHW